MYKKCFEAYSFEYVTENIIVCKDIYEVEDVESEIDFKLIEEVGRRCFLFTLERDDGRTSHL